ncbi:MULTISPECIES: hypothetical protein [unclassified Kitasatospora]|uniref:hypothetical protein n=1 Tax=unclassified Kitasatospora TaxID=2633591 RepID=UPI0033F21374
MAHPLEVNAVAEDGGNGLRLTATWTWAPGLLAEHEVRALAEEWTAALRALARTRPAPRRRGPAARGARRRTARTVRRGPLPAGPRPAGAPSASAATCWC